jgi:hypothetical protein
VFDFVVNVCYEWRMSNVMTLTPARIRVLSEIARDIAQVFFASVFIQPILTGETNILTFTAGGLLSIVWWFFSVGLTNK